MQPRYSLRFENGERKGETIPIPASGLTVGRKPGHTLQIIDNSVSGNHAELSVDKFGVTVKDQGSTNGTRIGGERVLEKRLAAGDQLIFGTVELTFLDAELGEAAPAPAPAALPHPGRGEGLERVSPELLARSRKVSRPGVVILVLLALGGAVWWWLNRSSGAPTTVNHPVEPVPGNLLAEDYSFEGDHDSWSGMEGAPQAFLRNTQAASSGVYGMGTDLAKDEWARARSKEVPVDADKELVAHAMLRGQDGLLLRLGIEFGHGLADAAGQPAGFVAWSRPLAAGSRVATAVEVSASVPPGYDRARVVIDARAANSARAGFDDVSLVVRGAAARPAAEASEARFYLHGDPPALGLLARGSRVFFSALEFQNGTNGAEPVPIAVRAEGPMILIAPAASDPRAKKLTLLVDGDLARGGLATLGADKAAKDSGFRSHGGGDFERARVGTLLFGSGRDLIALRTSAPIGVKGQREPTGVRVTIEFEGAATELSLQTDFREERKQAGNVAHDARAAQKKGDLGECLKQWKTLLDNYPYEEQLLKEAEETRSRLVQQGLEELRSVRTEIERARFFHLPELYQKCRDRALATGQRYSGSEVEDEAHNLVGELDQDLVGARGQRDLAEKRRLEAILHALEASQSAGLAAEVQSALAKPGGSK